LRVVILIFIQGVLDTHLFMHFHIKWIFSIPAGVVKVVKYKNLLQPAKFAHTSMYIGNIGIGDVSVRAIRHLSI
jgi:hypothetical protein